MRASGLCENLLPLPHRVRVTAIAELNDERRARFAARHVVPASGVFSTWQEFFENKRDVDAVRIGRLVTFDEQSLEIRDFDGEHVSRTEFGNLHGGHSGADRHIIDGFLRAIERNDQSQITTTIPESVTTHMLTFAAEHARLSASVVDVAGFAREHGVDPIWPNHRIVP